MKSNIFIDLLLLLLCLGISVPYLFIIKFIRKNEDKLGIIVDNYSVVNIPKMYILYIKARKIEGKKGGLVFFHVISIIFSLLIGFFLKQQGVIH
jgi:hypothetical protein